MGLPLLSAEFEQRGIPIGFTIFFASSDRCEPYAGRFDRISQYKGAVARL